MPTFVPVMKRYSWPFLLSSFAAVLWLVLSATIFVSCHSRPVQVENSLRPDSSAVIEYAHGFSIDYFRNYTRLTVYNPWKKGEISAVYYLISHAGMVTPDPKLTVIVPLHSMAATSCTHVAFLEALHELSTLKGMASPQLVYSADFRQLDAEGKMIDLGDPFHLNVEKTMELQPQMVMMTNYNQINTTADQLVQSGIPVVFNDEWMESTPLGRAEWIKFVAAFYNKGKLADSLFQNMTTRYLALKQLAQHASDRPSILVGNSFKGTWYMPSGTGFMGHLLADAQCSYYFSNNTTVGSIPVNFEQALQYFRKASVWLNCSAFNLTALKNSDFRYQLFKSFQNQQVYSLNGRITPNGGNDFWEGGVVHPDILLQDYIRVLHPALLPNQPLVYLMKMTE
jgi:iron complex transport system substrate-binding protein